MAASCPGHAVGALCRRPDFTAFKDRASDRSSGVSDHAKWPLGLPSLRPAIWSLTPQPKGVGAASQHRQSAVSRGEFDPQPQRELDGFLDALFTLVLAFGSKRLTPRGEPRQTAVVGVEHRTLNDGPLWRTPVAAATKSRSRIRFDASSFQRMPGAFGPTAFCAVHCSALPARAVTAGVSNPPVLRRLASRGRPGGCSRPDVRVANRCRN